MVSEMFFIFFPRPPDLLGSTSAASTAYTHTHMHGVQCKTIFYSVYMCIIKNRNTHQTFSLIFCFDLGDLLSVKHPKTGGSLKHNELNRIKS